MSHFTPWCTNIEYIFCMFHIILLLFMLLLRLIPDAYIVVYITLINLAFLLYVCVFCFMCQCVCLCCDRSVLVLTPQ
jgi:hypothetical protein